MTASSRSILLSPQVAFYPALSCLKNSDTGQSIGLTSGERNLFEIILNGQGSKENIIHQIWLKNGTVVGESGYYQLIKNLRRKLKIAGLPGSMIKTIPQYGVVFVNHEQRLVADNKENPDEGVEWLLSEADATERSETLNLPPCTKLVAESETICDELHYKKNEITDTKSERKISRRVAVLIFTCILTLPFIVIFLKALPPANFYAEVTIDKVRFHYFTPAQRVQENLSVIRQKLAEGVHDVYIAANGTKVWIAECNKDISQKDSQCQYEYFLSY